jgi:hypothetical protein
LIKKAEFTAGERAQVKGEVAADTAAAFKGLTRSTVASGEATGADVSSGKTKLALAANTRGAGKAKGQGQAAAETGGEIDQSMQQLRIAGFGRGIATGVTSDLSREARRATRLALAESEARFQRNQDLVNAGASIAGAAAYRVKNRKKPTTEESVALDRFDVETDLGLRTFQQQTTNPFNLKLFDS